MFVKPGASERPCWRTALSKAGSKDGPSFQMLGSMESHCHVKGGDGTAPGSSSLNLSMQESRTGLIFGMIAILEFVLDLGNIIRIRNTDFSKIFKVFSDLVFTESS